MSLKQGFVNFIKPNKRKIIITVVIVFFVLMVYSYFMYSASTRMGAPKNDFTGLKDRYVSCCDVNESYGITGEYVEMYANSCENYRMTDTESCELMAQNIIKSIKSFEENEKKQLKLLPLRIGAVFLAILVIYLFSCLIDYFFIKKKTIIK